MYILYMKNKANARIEVKKAKKGTIKIARIRTQKAIIL